MTVILPIIAILSVTSEWSQRTGLTTFTLVPHRGRVMLAKALAAVAGRDRLDAGRLRASAPSATWSAAAIAGIRPGLGHDRHRGRSTSSPATCLGLLIGLHPRRADPQLGRRRSSRYFVYAFVLPTLLGLLAGEPGVVPDLQPWVDFNFAQTALFDGGSPASSGRTSPSPAPSGWSSARRRAAPGESLRGEVTAR